MSGIIRPIIVEPLKHIHKMVTKPEYFTYSRLRSQLGKLPRYQDCQVKVNSQNLLIPDAASFLASYKELFVDRIYQFKSENTAPKILDIGANIGLSVLFFKHLYPQAQITAYEADPKIFNYLQKNVRENNYHDVELVNKAVWYENTTLNFVCEGADGGHVSKSDRDRVSLEIPAVDIAEILKSDRFEFIKIDIEGAEEFVLPRCQGLLDEVKFMFIEYHSLVESEQCLNKLLNILSEAKFRVHICSIRDTSFAPFTDLKISAGFDLQLNIFAWKEKQ